MEHQDQKELGKDGSAIMIVDMDHPDPLHGAVVTKLHQEQYEIVHIDQPDQLLDVGQLVMRDIYKDLPILSMYGVEKKKKEPCTYHEYVKRERVEISPNIYKEIWKCRHCDHPLN